MAVFRIENYFYLNQNYLLVKCHSRNKVLMEHDTLFLDAQYDTGGILESPEK